MQLVFVILRCIESNVVSVALTAVKCMASLVDKKQALERKHPRLPVRREDAGHDRDVS